MKRLHQPDSQTQQPQCQPFMPMRTGDFAGVDVEKDGLALAHDVLIYATISAVADIFAH
jgi:hypothetical protein